jgi:hypothetical protein
MPEKNRSSLLPANCGSLFLIETANKVKAREIFYLATIGKNSGGFHRKWTSKLQFSKQKKEHIQRQLG